MAAAGFEPATKGLWVPVSALLDQFIYIESFEEVKFEPCIFSLYLKRLDSHGKISD